MPILINIMFMKQCKFFIIILLTISGNLFVRPPRNHTDSLLFGFSHFRSKLDLLTSNRIIRERIKSSDAGFNDTRAQRKNSGYQLKDSLLVNQLGTLTSVIKIPYDPKISYYINMLVNENPDASSILLGLADHYIPLISPLLKSYDLPEELDFMPAAISCFNLYSNSINGNSGLWRLSFLNGRIGGLQINSYIDERKDITKSTQVAARFLQEYYSIYKDWTLALVAFNCGPANLNKAIRRAQGKNDFWSIYPFLPDDSRDNIPVYVAMNYLRHFHRNFEIMPKPIDLAIRVDTFFLTRPLYMQQVCRQLNISSNQLAFLNPRYKQDIIPKDINPSPLYLPLNCSAGFKTKMDSIFTYCDSVFKANSSWDVSLNTKPDNHQKNNKTKSSKSTPANFYIVKPGDTLERIAGRYHVSVTDLKSWNSLRSDNLKVNQKIALHKVQPAK